MYDLKANPAEQRNLFHAPKHVEKLHLYEHLIRTYMRSSAAIS